MYVKPFEGMALEENHKKAKKEWFKRHKDDEWDEVLFIDECIIKGGKKSNRQWKKIGKNKVNRKKNSGLKNQYLGRNIDARKTPLKIYTHNITKILTNLIWSYKEFYYMNSEFFIKTIRELKKYILKIAGNPVVLVLIMLLIILLTIQQSI